MSWDLLRSLHASTKRKRISEGPVEVTTFTFRLAPDEDLPLDRGPGDRSESQSVASRLSP